MMFCPKCGSFCEINYEKNAYVCLRCGTEAPPPLRQELRRKIPLMK